jgi:hypothetical protein
MSIKRIFLLLTSLSAVGAHSPCAEVQPPTLKTEHFDRDPGWDNSSNRVEASDPPTVTQDFGWSPGRIGGTVWQSTTPAWYGMPLERPLSFKDKFSASGKIAAMPGSVSKRGVAYLGFFNHERQGWRPWSTMAIRVVSTADTTKLYIDYTSGLWNAGAAETEIEFPTDGSEHTWRFSYDPDKSRAPWTDMRLRSYLITHRMPIAEILATGQKTEPDLTIDALEKRLDAARNLGLVTYLPRGGKRYFQLKQDTADLKGEVSIQLDDGPVLRTYLDARVRDQPVVLDRFGIYNMQLYHAVMKFFVSDLVVNGRKIDLGKDPGWEGKGNRATFLERDFQRQNFGYSPDTQFAGGAKGEIGGQFYNVEPVDPLHGYYADDIGALTLDDPIRFSGKVSFIEGSTDAGMFFGFFRAQDEKTVLPPNARDGQAPGWPQANMLGIVVDGPANIGWWFKPTITAADRKLAKDRPGVVFLPTRESRTFEFDYDPAANSGVGRITVKLDKEEPFSLDLSPEQRKAGATFDRFGLMSFRRGGKYSTLYFDDLTYTTRRASDAPSARHDQKITTVPYPPSGRKY